MSVLKRTRYDSYTRQKLPLLDFGKEINAQDRRGETQLHKELKAGIFRCEKSKYAFQTTKLLIAHGSDMNICSRDGTSPLQEAFLSGILAAVEAFIPEEDQLLRSGQVDNVIRCRYLIKHFLEQGRHLDVSNSKYSTLLHFAAMHGDNEGFNLILSKCSPNLDAFNSKGTTLLHIVTSHGTCEMIESLVNHGADPNLPIQLDPAQQNLTDKIRGFTPLHLAVSKGKFNIVEVLVKNGANVNAPSPYGSPLHIACETFYCPKFNDRTHYVKNLKIVKLLIQNGAKLETLNSAKKTPLQVACDNKYEKMVEVLLQEGANFRMKGHQRQRRSTLHYIVSINHVGIMKLFLNKDLDPNVRDCREETPLIYGARSCAKGISMDIVELLVKNGADINSADVNGITALHVAANLFDLGVVKHLLKLKANVNASSKNGLTPLGQVLSKFRGHKITRKSTAFKTLQYLCIYTALSVSKGAANVNLNLLEDQPSVKAFYQLCEQEIVRMRTETVCDTSCICYFDLLEADLHKLTLILRNEDIMEVLGGGEYKEKFPACADLLKHCVEEGKIRRNLTDKGSLLLKKLIKRQLPYFVNDMIFNSLTLKDLKNFEKAFCTHHSKLKTSTTNLRLR